MRNAILMILAPEKFRDIEYIVPRAFFEAKGYRVITSSTKITSTGRFGFEVTHLTTADKIVPDEYEGLYIVGGAGVLALQTETSVRNLVEVFLEQNKPIGAICAAPRLLLAWGKLQNKRMTGHNGDGRLLILATEGQAEYLTDREVVVDGLFLTANGPEAAELSALEFMKLLE
ncbi:MAG: DJ-1/PfpI family protein [Cytophagaceae bacterium]|nr:DJ-1/PfpI family protein [Cytophagaceae bacterium]